MIRVQIRSVIFFLNSNFPIIHPANPLRILWTFIHLICITFLAVSIPYILAFKTREIAGWYRIGNLVSYFVFIVDIILSSRTGFYENGIVCLNGERILHHWGRELIPSILVVVSGMCF